MHASDFAYNLEVLSNLPPYKYRNTEDVKTDIDETDAGIGHKNKTTNSINNTHTVAFVFSDGDNLQILQNDWVSSSHWNAPARLNGSSPRVGWSYSPAMAVLMPSLLAYAHRTARPTHDSLSAGPSGIGYTYPQLFPR